MSLTLRRVKGNSLTHDELDDNFEYLDNRINTKANATHTHGIADVSGLQTALDNKIDLDDVNVPNGLLQLGADGKVPCEFLKDCFGVADKANTADLIENGKIKASLLPDSTCDCEQIEEDITNLQNSLGSKVNHDDLFDIQGKVKVELLPNNVCDCSSKHNRLRNFRIVSGAITLMSNDDVLIITNSSVINLTGAEEGQIIKIRRIHGNVAVGFSSIVQFSNEEYGQQWETGVIENNMELIYASNTWYQIG